MSGEFSGPGQDIPNKSRKESETDPFQNIHESNEEIEHINQNELETREEKEREEKIINEIKRLLDGDPQSDNEGIPVEQRYQGIEDDLRHYAEALVDTRDVKKKLKAEDIYKRTNEVAKYMEDKFLITDLSISERLNLRKITQEVMVQYKREGILNRSRSFIRNEIFKIEKEKKDLRQRANKLRYEFLKEIEKNLTLPNGGILGINIETTLRWLDSEYGIDLNKLPASLFTPNRPYTNFDIYDKNGNLLFEANHRTNRGNSGYIENYLSSSEAEEKFRKRNQEIILSRERVDPEISDMIRSIRDKANHIN